MLLIGYRSQGSLVLAHKTGADFTVPASVSSALYTDAWAFTAYLLFNLL